MVVYQSLVFLWAIYHLFGLKKASENVVTQGKERKRKLEMEEPHSRFYFNLAFMRDNGGGGNSKKLFSI